MEYGLDTHILVTKGGHNEYLAKTTWDNIKPGKEGDRDGYFLVATTPPEVVEMQQIKELKTKSQVIAESEAKEPVIDSELIAAPQPVKEAAKRGPKKKA